MVCGRTKYEGQWVNDKKEGKGIFTWPTGGQYEGDFKNNRKNGEGVYSNGSQYTGGWKDNYYHGKGVMIYLTASSTAASMEHGQGVMIYPDDSQYDGEEDGNFHGKGNEVPTAECTMASGRTARSGKGVMIYPDGGKYDGKWKDGKKHGRDFILPRRQH